MRPGCLTAVAMMSWGLDPSSAYRNASLLAK